MGIRTAKELEGDTTRAVQILELFTDPKKGRDVKTLIPPSVLREAHGICIIRLYRIGFMLSAKSGSGVIIARMPDGSWSAPSGVSMSSLGFGHQAGGEVIDSIIVMNYRAAVKAFFDGGQLQLGVGASLSAGPYGRAADVSASASSGSHISATYAYSQSKGLYMGYSFEGSKISERVNTNKAFYGRPITAREILTGVVPPPNIAGRLYQILDHLGAGARPGLPFAPKKAVNNLQQQQQVPVPPPPQQQQNRPTKSEEFDEPPPPYQPISGSSDVDVPAGAPPVNTSTYPPPSSSQTVDDAAATTYPKEKESYKPEEPTQYGESSSSNPMQRSISAENTVSSPAAEAAPPPPPPPPPPAAETAAPATVETMQPKSMPSETLDETVNSKPLPSFEPNTGPAEVPASIEPVADEPKESGSVARMVAAMQAASLAKQEAPSADEYPTNVKPEGENNTSIVVAKYDYVATQPSDLSFYEGDHITVTKRLDDRQCWWEGEVNGQKGFFPANYTDDLN